MQPQTAEAADRAVVRFDAIGTDWRITSARPLPDRLRGGVLALCEDFDRTWSRFRTDSLVAEIAHATNGGRFEFPARDVPLLNLYDRLASATAGAVDPLVGRDLDLLGYDTRYSLLPDEAGLATSATCVPDSWSRDVHRDETSLVTGRPVVIDVGAAGKGHLVDLVADILRASGVEDYLVDGGGDLRHHGPEPVMVGLEHPTRPGRAIGAVPLRDAALCASATTRRAWGNGLHHILDGRTRKPAPNVVAAWAIADDTATADGLATALFIAEPETLSTFAFTWVRMLADGRVQ